MNSEHTIPPNTDTPEFEDDDEMLESNADLEDKLAWLMR